MKTTSTPFALQGFNAWPSITRYLTLLITSALLLGLSTAQEADVNDIESDRMIVLPRLRPKQEVPVFYSVSADVRVALKHEQMTSVQRLKFKVHQGKAKTLTVDLNGEGKVLGVEGGGIKGWALRTETSGQRFLDIHTQPGAGDTYPTELEAVVNVESKWKGHETQVLLVGPSESTGYGIDLRLDHDGSVNVEVMQISGLSEIDTQDSRGAKILRYIGNESPQLRLQVAPSGLKVDGLEMANIRLLATLEKDGRSVGYQLDGLLRSEKEGSKLELLRGAVAVMEQTSGDGWRIGLRRLASGEWAHELIATRAGEFPIRLRFATPVIENGDWRRVEFSMLAGVVVPIELEGFEKGVEFSTKHLLVPRERRGRLYGFLPATGLAAMEWQKAEEVKDGSLFFSSTGTTDVRVGSGLMRQSSVINLRVLQGKLNQLAFELAGKGEILSVHGDSTVVGWKVSEKDGKRLLEVSLSRPVEKSKQIVIESQVGMEGKPLEAQAIRISPVGALRHSGFLRVANQGSVRVEVMNTSGLIQLAPDQFPGSIDKSLRQAVVYRFPSADYAYKVNASQVLPEISVNEVTIYELGESDRKIQSDIELDIREAPVREWILKIPADHAVSSVTGAQVADYAVGSDVDEGMRSLTILFKGPVMNRQLVQVVMARNQAPKAGLWQIQPLGFVDVKSRRGYIGALTAPGYRLEAQKSDGLAEIPVSFFPGRATGLQQAFRLREMDWSLDLKVEALGQSVQADVFHLYSLKAGAIYGSVVINYFVVGAPASEWKIQVPDGIGNIDVTGQNVGRDWRRNGNTVVVPLSRPVLGAGIVLLTFEQPMSSQGGKLFPGAVVPLDIQGERGVIQVVSPQQVNHRSTRKGSLLEIDPTEIPTEFQLLSSAPTLKAWQYTARDFEIDMDIEWFEPGETISQLVDFQELSTHVSRDGQWVTDASIFVKSKGRSVLSLRLPEGSNLWEARVEDKAVNARSDGGRILVPLATDIDPNQSLEISLRYGAQADKAKRPVLAAPRFEVPVVIGRWQVTGDEGQRLSPRGGTANLIAPVDMQNGWEWLALNTPIVVVLLVLSVAAVMLLQSKTGSVCSIFGLLLALAGVCFALGSSVLALVTTDPGSDLLEYAAPVVGADQAITVELANQGEFASRFGLLVMVGLIVGIGLLVHGIMKRDRMWLAGSTAVILGSVLCIQGGAAPFLVLVAMTLGIWWLPKLIKEISHWNKRRIENAKQRAREKANATASAAGATVLALMMWMVPATSEAAPKPELNAAESVTHDWDIRDGRLYGSVEITLSAEAGERYLLLQHPAVLNEFTGNGLKVINGVYGKNRAYWLVATESGRLTGSAEFEMPVNPAQGWDLPTGPAAMQKLKVQWDESGWEFTSPSAVKVEPLAVAGKDVSAASMLLTPMQQVTIQARARQRDVSAETTRFYSEVSNLFMPGPGVVNGRHLVTIRPAQGQVRQLTLKVPEGYTVSDVVNGPVGNWRFDPDSRELRVIIKPAQSSHFGFVVETQRSAGDLPVDLTVTPLRVNGAAGEVGLIGMAFGQEVQPEGLKPEGLSKVNPSDFNSSLIPVDASNQPVAVLLHAFRYGVAKASLSLRVNPVAPELRANIWQLVSLGEDRLLVTADIDVLITRSGVFRLQLEIADALEVESATGEGLSHWTQMKGENGLRVVTLHLNGKSIGSRSFSLALVGRPVTESKEWMVPKVMLQDASRETGVLTVVPERGLRVRAIKRKNIAQLDPRQLAGQKNAVSRAAVRPDALSYRLLQSDWELGLSIRRLEPWVTANLFQDATIREGQVLTRAAISYRIDNAAVKSRRVKITGLDEKAAATLRATGPAVADFVPVEGQKELWEIRFRRGIAGHSEVTIEFQRPSSEMGMETITPIELIDVRQTNTVVALRAGGRLELEAQSPPRGWQPVDWSAVQGQIGGNSGVEAPHLIFKVADSDGPLKVIMKRHDLANLRKIRVSEGSLTSLLSRGGNVLTTATMRLEVVAKSTMRLRLPEGAELFNVFINGEGAPMVRVGDEWLFYVFPRPDGRSSELRFTYAASMRKGKVMQGPVLDVPMENLTWRVLVPEGYRLSGYGGDFDLQQAERGSLMLTESYQEVVISKNEVLKKSAVQLFDQGNKWAAEGDQQKAIMAYSNVLNSGNLDEASTEDARVQLRKLKTQQAVLGLNSRRQRLIIDNRAAEQQGQAAQQIDQAAALNPVLQGKYNFDPNQFERFLDGNSVDENAALKAIANRVVAQQLAAEPAPAALDITLPENGTVLSFNRSVQVGSDEAMTLEIQLEKASGGFSLLAVLLCLAISGVVFMKPRSKK